MLWLFFSIKAILWCHYENPRYPQSFLYREGLRNTGKQGEDARPERAAHLAHTVSWPSCWVVRLRAVASFVEVLAEQPDGAGFQSQTVGHV